jgi:hypothetical protein
VISALLLTLVAAPGLAVGDSVAAFEPYWVTGEYEGTNQCPVCEYTIKPMVYIWTHGKGPANLGEIVRTIDKVDSAQEPDALRSFLVDANLENDDKASVSRLTGWAKDWKAESVWFLSRPTKLKVCLKNYKLESAKGWNSVVYFVKGRKVQEVFIDPSTEDLPKLENAAKKLLK